MSADLPYRPARDAADVERFAELLVQGFAVPPEWARVFPEWAGHDALRLLGRGTRAEAGLGILRMGQYFGGARVDCAGIAGVAVAPERRGEGLGSRIVRAALAELAASGTALACLYPASIPFYRALGFELAGGRYEVRVPCATLHAGRREARLVRLDDALDPRVARCYARAAIESNGWLDRHPFLWRRVREQRGEFREGLGVAALDDASELSGYVWFARRAPPGPAGGRFEIVLSDVVALDGDAGRAILQCLADHRTVAGDVSWCGGPADALRDLVPEVGARVSLLSPWMLRVVDVAAALEARGYPPDARAAIQIEVEDDLLAHNRDRFVLEVEGGSGRVRRGGAGHAVMDVRDLAALFSGHAGSGRLARFGRLRAATRDRRALDLLFAGPVPAMPDMF